MPQPLPSKENALFRQIVKAYETKQYKKGIKAADQILRKVPDHGDTQAMKALILNSQGNQEEAFVLAKTALRNDMKSHICWHVYGLLYRSVKNYEEAIKAYKFALKFEPDSPNILRDLGLLQAQMRDYQGYIQTRTIMLKQGSRFRQNWTALAVAHHLAGELAEAEKVLTMYEDTLKTPPPPTDTEHSEAVLYKNSIIAESGDIKRALEHLEKIEKRNLDRAAVMELKAQYLLQLDRKEEAEKAYRALLDRNAEYRAYYEGLEKALGLDRSKPEDRKALAELYKSYADKSERIDAARRIPLDFLEGDEFRQAANEYLRRKLSKGIPSAFANIKGLYKDEAKKAVISELVHGYESADKVNGDASDKFLQAVYYFLAQHYNYHLSRDLQKAMEYVERAIELDPKSVDYNMTKARIWKHHGNTKKAAEAMEYARTLDEKDRYINTKCAKYQLRNNDNEAAIKTMSKFTRNETVGGPLGDLHDMQCMWYITEDGEAHLRQGNLGLALKRFKAIYDIFDVWQEDQFDFHSFSLRKGQIRAYVDMVRWEDHLREHPFYARAAIPAIKAYIMLADKPHLAHGVNDTTVPNFDGLDEVEKKKAIKKAKKEQEKAEAERKEAEKKAAAKKPGTGGDGEPKKEDPDPQGLTLLQTKQPLQDAMKFLTPLLEFSPKLIEAQTIGFELYLRREKYLLALKCLLAAHELDPENPTVHEQAVRFRKTLDSLSAPLPDSVAETINQTFTLLPKDVSLAAHNDAFLARHGSSAAHVRAALTVRQLLDPASQAQNETDLLATLDLPTLTLDDAAAGLAVLADWKSGPEAKERYREKAAQRWPEATVFEKKA